MNTYKIYGTREVLYCLEIEAEDKASAIEDAENHLRFADIRDCMVDMTVAVKACELEENEE